MWGFQHSVLSLFNIFVYATDTASGFPGQWKYLKRSKGIVRGILTSYFLTSVLFSYLFTFKIWQVSLSHIIVFKNTWNFLLPTHNDTSLYFFTNLLHSKCCHVATTRKWDSLLYSPSDSYRLTSYFLALNCVSEDGII